MENQENSFSEMQKELNKIHEEFLQENGTNDFLKYQPCQIIKPINEKMNILFYEKL